MMTVLLTNMAIWYIAFRLEFRGNCKGTLEPWTAALGGLRRSLAVAARGRGGTEDMAVSSRKGRAEGTRNLPGIRDTTDKKNDDMTTASTATVR